MANFPVSATIFSTSAGWTAAQAVYEFEKWLTSTLQLPGAAAAEALTISSGNVAPTKSIVVLDTEGAAAADDLSTIALTNLHTGAVVFITSANSARVITVKNGASYNNITTLTGADYALAPGEFMMLRRDGTVWREMVMPISKDAVEKRLTGALTSHSHQTNGFRNLVINPGMAVDQRKNGTSQTITAGAAKAYTVDRWFAYCTGANVTGQRVAGPTTGTYRYQFTGATSNTAIGFGTRLESENTTHLAGGSAVLQVKLKSTSITSLTWTAYYATTKDTFGSIASPTKTQIATGTFTINSTEATYSASISIPAAATTGIEVIFTCGALVASQTLTIGDVVLEKGSIASGIENRPVALEMFLCRRYYYSAYFSVYSHGANSATQGSIYAPQRTTPAVSWVSTYQSNVAAFTVDCYLDTVPNLTSLGIRGLLTSNASGSGNWVGYINADAEM